MRPPPLIADIKPASNVFNCLLLKTQKNLTRGSKNPIPLKTWVSRDHNKKVPPKNTQMKKGKNFSAPQKKKII